MRNAECGISERSGLRFRNPHSAFRISLVLGLLLAVACPAAGQTKEDKIKAAMLVQFARYTTWPDGKFDGEDEPVVIGVVGDDVMAAELSRQLAAGAVKVKDRPVTVRRLAAVDPDNEREARRFMAESESLHVLYIGEPSRGRRRDVLKLLEGKPLLTVADAPQFADDGGMIGLFLRENRYRFEVNLRSVKRAGLKLSAKVLELARRVIRED